MDTKILIVDDSNAVVEALTNILSNQGYGVESYNDGESGWNRLVAGAERKMPMPDLLLLDLNMPGINGLELLRRIRTDERFALLPVVILTVEDDADTRMMALEGGASGYLPKPVQTVELLARVKTFIGWKRAERIEQRRMERLIEAGRILLSTLDLDSVLQRVMKIAMDEMDVEDTSIWLRESEGNLECRAAVGNVADRLVGIRMASGEGVAGWVLQHKRSALVLDAHTDPRFNPKVDELIEFRTRDLVTVPLLVRGTGIGVLQAVNKKQGPFSSTDLAWMEVLAPLAAAAIASARLFQELRQRTAQLQQRTEQLQQRTEELQTHNEELDAFAHTVAHDLKNPVSNIYGYATMIEETHDQLSEEDLYICLNAITQGSRKMIRIIEELLLLAGVRKKKIEMRPLDMASIVAEAIERLSSMIEENKVEVILPETWPIAVGYGPWVEEVWANYINNAIKYGGQPPRVELGTTEGGDDVTPRTVSFWVRDNGPGLTLEDQAQLFVPFTQLDQIRVEGHGLGLSIVRRIMEKLGGQVGIESGIGQGSLFFFTLPSMTSESEA
ncbi:MAG: response regulator [Chloroflexi bacterium]|nr:response regulator [Chloroflexota bacterium]